MHAQKIKVNRLYKETLNWVNIKNVMQGNENENFQSEFWDPKTVFWPDHNSKMTLKFVDNRNASKWHAEKNESW